MKNLKKVLVALLCLVMVFALVACQAKTEVVTKEANAVEGELTGKTVILHSNDVHGAVEGYAYMKWAKDQLEAQGANVILVDAGDFTNGSTYVSLSKGASAVTLMNQAGYDIATLGNHEFDFGYDSLVEELSAAEFNVLCSNITKGNKTLFDANMIYQVGDLKVGFFALSTPETQTKVNPGMIKGLKFTEKEALYAAAQEQIDALKENCDLVVALCHLGVDDESEGNRSVDVWANVTGLDFMIDGHSHTVMTEGTNGEKIQSTGTEFANIGVIVIDNETKEIVENYLVSVDELEQDADVLATATNVIDTVDEQYGSKFAETSVLLEGTKAIVRSQETNLGDLICDAMVWSVLNETKLDVSKDNVVAVTNGGGIRATVQVGDITRNDIFTVLPFGNTIAVNYVTGAELLESLEASTYCTPDAIGGFPQISGMKIKVDTTVEFAAGEEYPDSTYAQPAEIKRVTILEVNGKAFDENATYAVVTNNFTAAGGDTYYAFKRAYDAGNGFDTSIPMDEAVVAYIMSELGGVVGEQYAEPAGRIEIVK